MEKTHRHSFYNPHPEHSHQVFMNDLKAAFLTTFSSAPAFVVAISTRADIAVISSIILPILFFVLSKTIDVCVQLYLRRSKK